MHAMAINEKRCHKFGGERGGWMWEGLDGGKGKKNFN